MARLTLRLAPNEAREICRRALASARWVSWTVLEDTYSKISGVGAYLGPVEFPFLLTFKVLQDGVGVTVDAVAPLSSTVENLCNSIEQLADEYLDSLEQMTPARHEKATRAVFDGNVFISYAREDAQFVDKLGKDLFLSGLTVWIDKGALRAGDRWPEKIKIGIEESHAVVVVASPDALSSKSVKRELSHARKAKKIVLPVIYQPEFPELFNGPFANIELCDLAKGKYRGGLQELVEVIKQNAGN